MKYYTKVKGDVKEIEIIQRGTIISLVQTYHFTTGKTQMNIPTRDIFTSQSKARKS
jgi:hypothetical protein